MASLYITTRKTKKSGARFVVRYRLGGSAYPVQDGGHFRTKKEARARRDLIAGELAAGRNPRDLLRTMFATPEAALTIADWKDKFLASRIDAAKNTIKGYTSSLKKACDHFDGRDPFTITGDEIAAWVASLADEHKPATVALYRTHLGVLLDFVGVDPNPVRDKRVKLPKRDHETRIPPSADHFEAIVAAATPRFRLALVTVEQSAVREGELVRITWGDLDGKNLRVLIPASSTKTRKPRWVQLPEWLFDAIEKTCPPDDRTPDRRVFQGITEARLYQAMKRACQKAEVPHYTVHDLRRRRITLWHHSGVPQKDYMARSGHTRYSVSLDVYTHAMPIEEVGAKKFQPLLVGTALPRSTPTRSNRRARRQR